MFPNKPKADKQNKDLNPHQKLSEISHTLEQCGVPQIPHHNPEKKTFNK